jgi:limonene-1,2-epoxide hydrolase
MQTTVGAAEEENVRTLHGFVEAFLRKDVEKALSYFQDDAIAQSPDGTFKGKNQLKRYLIAQMQFPDIKIVDYGINVLAKGNTVIYEFEERATYQGKKFSAHVVSVAEMKNGKFQYVRDYYDRLSIAKQVVTGRLATRAVDSIINEMEKYLHQ